MVAESVKHMCHLEPLKAAQYFTDIYYNTVTAFYMLK